MVFSENSINFSSEGCSFGGGGEESQVFTTSVSIPDMYVCIYCVCMQIYIKCVYVYCTYICVSLFRTAELKSLKGRKYLDALCVYFWATTPVLISILTFATYAAMGKELTAAKVCVCAYIRVCVCIHTCMYMYIIICELIK